ncbi:hypothetical protein ACFV0L_10435 [Streptosporangium canum]|uniref:hypothetical protein n=1 Tax=Streptosporangium canum TaxID=324952 RepID=UPI00369FB8E4
MAELDELLAAFHERYGVRVSSGSTGFSAENDHTLAVPTTPIGEWKPIPGLPIFVCTAETDDFLQLHLWFDWSPGTGNSIDLAVVVVDENEQILRFLHTEDEHTYGTDPAIWRTAAAYWRIWPYQVRARDVSSGGRVRLALASVDREPRSADEGTHPPYITGHEKEYPFSWRIVNFRRPLEAAVYDSRNTRTN